MFGDNWLIIPLLIFIASIIFHQVPLLIVSLLLFLSGLISKGWSRYCLSRVEYQRQFSADRLFCGEEVKLGLRIANRKMLPLVWVEVEDELPEAVTTLRAKLSPSHNPTRVILRNLLSLSWYESVTRYYTLLCLKRGYYSFGPARIRSGDIFGFFINETRISDVNRLLVYPKVLPIAKLGIPSKQPFGDLKAKQHIFEDPARTIGVRRYSYGDSQRKIHWKATARTQKFQVKLQEPTTTLDLLLFLNVSTFDPEWQGVILERLELAIIASASLANHAIEQGYPVGICVNTNFPGGDQQIKIMPSRNPEQLTRILEALAKTTPFATVPMSRFLHAESRNLPWGSTVVLVTGIITEEIALSLDRVRKWGHRVTLVLVGDDAPKIDMPNIDIHRVVGEKMWNELQELQLA